MIILPLSFVRLALVFAIGQFLIHLTRCFMVFICGNNKKHVFVFEVSKVFRYSLVFKNRCSIRIHRPIDLILILILINNLTNLIKSERVNVSSFMPSSCWLAQSYTKSISTKMIDLSSWFIGISHIQWPDWIDTIAVRYLSNSSETLFVIPFKKM